MRGGSVPPAGHYRRPRRDTSTDTRAVAADTADALRLPLGTTRRAVSGGRGRRQSIVAQEPEHAADLVRRRRQGALKPRRPRQGDLLSPLRSLKQKQTVSKMLFT